MSLLFTGVGISEEVGRSLANMKLSRKYIFIYRVQYFTELYMLCWIRMESFIRNRAKCELVYTTHINIQEPPP